MLGPYFLPPQLIYKGTTHRCLPTILFSLSLFYSPQLNVVCTYTLFWCVQDIYIIINNIQHSLTSAYTYIKNVHVPVWINKTLFPLKVDGCCFISVIIPSIALAVKVGSSIRPVFNATLAINSERYHNKISHNCNIIILFIIFLPCSSFDDIPYPNPI